MFITNAWNEKIKFSIFEVWWFFLWLSIYLAYFDVRLFVSETEYVTLVFLQKSPANY